MKETIAKFNEVIVVSGIDVNALAPDAIRYGPSCMPLPLRGRHSIFFSVP